MRLLNSCATTLYEYSGLKHRAKPRASHLIPPDYGLGRMCYLPIRIARKSDPHVVLPCTTTRCGTRNGAYPGEKAVDKSPVSGAWPKTWISDPCALGATGPCACRLLGAAAISIAKSRNDSRWFEFSMSKQTISNGRLASEYGVVGFGQQSLSRVVPMLKTRSHHREASL